MAACLFSTMSAMAQTSDASQEDTLTILMRQFADVEVTATRVQQTTLSHRITDNETLNRDNTGQNLPYLLSTIPISAYAERTTRVSI